MAHFAKLNESNQVISVEVINNEVITDSEGNEQEQMGIDFLTHLNGGGWYKQTSYNGNFRKNYAGVGDTYNPSRDAFIAPQPYNSWTLDEVTCLWEAPTLHPTDDKPYIWNEDTLSWDEIT